MATGKGKGITRTIFFFLDRKSADKAQVEMEKTFDEAGRKGGENFYRELKRAFDRTTAQLREDLAKGVIDEKEFKKRSDAAAKAFNSSLLKSLDEARKKGDLADREYVKLTRSLRRVGDEGKKAAGFLTSGFAKVAATVASAFAIRGIARWTADVVSLGVAGEETASKYETTFGAATEQMDTFIESFRQLAGLSRNEAREATATVGAMARGMGYGEEAAAALAQQVLQLAGDMTSFNNVPIEETLRAVRSAITGERESLKTLGIVIQQADVDTRALAMSGKENAKALTQQEKAAATLALIQERMGPAAGDLVRTQDSLANQARRVAAAWRTWKEELGQALATSENGPSVLQALGDSIEQMTGWVRTNASVLQDWANKLLSVARAGASIINDWAWLRDPAGMAAQQRIGSIRAQGNADNPALLAVMAGREQARMRELQLRIGELAGAGKVVPRELINELQEAKRVNAFLIGEIQRLAQVQTEPPPTAPPGTPAAVGGATGGGVTVNVPGIDGRLASSMGIPTPPVPDLQPILERHQIVAEGVAEGWLRAFALINDEGNGLGQSLANLGNIIASGGIGGIYKLAKAKVLQNLADAAEMFAKSVGWISLGNVASAAAAKASATMHLGAAAKWAAVAAATGAGGASGGGGSGRGVAGLGGSGNFGGAEAENTTSPGPEVHIYIDPLDPSRPAVQKTVYVANQLGLERFGENARVYIHPARGR